jgi:hypothetical protein
VECVESVAVIVLRYAAASTVTESGIIQNDGCDFVQNAQWSNSDGLSGTENLSKPADVPAYESTTPVGWWSTYPTVQQWRQTLGDFSGKNYAGRQATERQGFPNSDSCYYTGAPSGGPYGLSLGSWLVGFWYDDNVWGDDYVGQTPAVINDYRLNLRPPCSATATQLMYLYTHGNQLVLPGSAYLIDTVGFGLPDYSTVQVFKNGQTASRGW